MGDRREKVLADRFVGEWESKPLPSESGSFAAWTQNMKYCSNTTLSSAGRRLLRGSEGVCVVFANLNLLQMDGGAG